MNSSENQNYTSWFAMFLLAVLCARLVSLWFNNSELFFDEAQYWFWSTDLEFGYFSKPPLLAWIIASTTSVCGSQSEFCVRLAAPILHAGTAIFVFLTAQRLYDDRTAFWSGITYLLLPAVSLSSTIISTDVPLLFCWALALYAYVRLSERFEWSWAVLLGLAIGLGLNAKYAMIYFIGCGLLHTLVCQTEMTPARKPGFWLAVALAGLMLAPNLLWNLDNDFITASHTGDNIGWTGLNLNWTGFFEFFGSQFGVFGPVLFGLFLATVFQMSKDSISAHHRLLLVFSLPVLALILIQAVISKAYANWAAVTYIAATILVVEIMVNRLPWHWMRTTLAIHGVTALVLLVAVCFAGKGEIPLPSGIEPFKRTQGASLIAGAISDELDEFTYNGVITTDRKLSALLQYNLRDREESIHAWRHGETPRDHFELVVPFQESVRDPALLVSRSENIDAMTAAFKSVTPLGERRIEAGEVPAVYLFRLEGHEAFE